MYNKLNKQTNSIENVRKFNGTLKTEIILLLRQTVKQNNLYMKMSYAFTGDKNTVFFMKSLVLVFIYCFFLM